MTSRRRAAVFAGAALVLFTLLSILHFTVIELHLVVSDDAAPAAEFVRSSEALFRVGIVLDCLIFGSGIVAFAALYVLLRDVEHLVAVLGLALMHK